MASAEGRSIMDGLQFPEQAQLVFRDFLVWVGYGTIVGLLAKAIMPGRDPGGPVATLAMGITGVVIGCGVWSLFSHGERVTPISPLGLFAGTTGAFVILAFYRLLAGYWLAEGVPPPRRRVARPNRRRRYPVAEYYDE